MQKKSGIPFNIIHTYMLYNQICPRSYLGPGGILLLACSLSIKELDKYYNCIYHGSWLRYFSPAARMYVWVCSYVATAEGLVEEYNALFQICWFGVPRSPTDPPGNGTVCSNWILHPPQLWGKWPPSSIAQGVSVLHRHSSQVTGCYPPQLWVSGLHPPQRQGESPNSFTAQGYVASIHHSLCESGLNHPQFWGKWSIFASATWRMTFIPHSSGESGLYPLLYSFGLLL